MQQFLIENWLNLLFGLLSAGILAYLKNLKKTMISYKSFLNEQDEKRIRKIIKDELGPVIDELNLEKAKFEAIKNDYRIKLITMCELCLDKGYLTTKEYSSLTELWKIYHDGLGGNGQGEMYYKKACALPVKDEQ